MFKNNAMKTTYTQSSSSHSPLLSPKPLPSQKALDALIFLTDEPDEHIYINIANAIVNYGENILPLLKKKLNETADVFHKERLENLIDIIEKQSLINKLNLWHEKREYDLLEPYFILSKYRFPNSDWSSIGFQIIMIIEQAEKEINYNLTPLGQVKVLNHIIYGVNKFRGDKIAVANEDYYYVNKLFETRIGNPFSLGMLYCIVAECLKLPIYPIVLPHHFVLAYCKKTRHFPKLEDVLFYINPFNNGIVLTRKDIRNYLYQLNIKTELKYFEPTRNSSVVKNIFNTSRLITNP